VLDLPFTQGTFSHLTVATALLVWGALSCVKSTGWAILLGLPSTLAHELSHWIVALFLGARPSFPSIIPRKDGKNWVLGSVRFYVRTATAALVALAPLWVLLPLSWGLVTAEPALTGEDAILRGVVIAYLVRGCVPSSPDIKIALADPIGLAVFGLFATIGYQGILSLGMGAAVV
jgi:hypothetical protein